MRAQHRITRNTVKVAQTNLQIIEFMRGRSCRIRKVCIEFRMSESGMRKYMVELVQEGVLRTTVEGSSSNAHYLYSMALDEKKIAAFVVKLKRYISDPESVVEIPRRRVYKPRKKKVEVSGELLPGTRIHLMQDDPTIPLRKLVNQLFEIKREDLDEFFFSVAGMKAQEA